MMKSIHVYSEVGTLKKVLLHRPGEELNQLHPDYLQDMLFEDTPYLPVAQQEHDAFATALRDNGVEIVYMRDLFEKAMFTRKARVEFVGEFLEASNVPSLILKKTIEAYYLSKEGEVFTDAILQGVRRDAIKIPESSLANYIQSDYPFLVDPLSAIYYMRDNSISVGNGSIISRMSKKFRARESILLKYIHKYSGEFDQSCIKYWLDEDVTYGIEGGDVAVLSDKVVAIGCSERTTFGAIEHIAEKLFKSGFERVLVFDMVEKKRATMHLDDIMTMIDYDKFIINAMMNDREKVNIYQLTQENNHLQITPMNGSLKEIFEYVLAVDNVTLISCGRGDLVQGIREMWNLGANVLTIAPGKVIAFARNDITNQQLTELGIDVIRIPDSELVKGRGGPRCMSMPLYREE
ncbi:arginine deiminase [Salmonella enterica subsp. diarizonae]|uniref:arginine deiminase n=1 Tax=Salmonella enterica TaxID=28901 RepID=UPI0009ADF385|nr:arginine deiminase family protein [Salmonella enterica]EAW2451565.1 arginine deiminase [Salmonella enterica subsp. diarizonae]EHG2955528.1 arginine deiminase [Salmonella enterica subsp. diarizonae serovar 53:r:z35]EHG6070486.1 arginine deiminase [Salmonella enterica subsp. diarizonae serovar 61:z52:z53]ECI5214752.1 arginine deiminase [Salmonella enterica subsp. diarizonae]EDL8432109.1 arginine deiminase [Salmonella enterica subsp. diarizonae]